MRKLASILTFIMLVTATSCHKDSHTTLIYHDDFNTDYYKWQEGCDGFACFSYDGGKYTIGVDQQDFAEWAVVPGLSITSAYSITVDCSIHLNDFTKWGGAGLVFNWTDNSNFDYFMISSYGDCAIYKVTKGASTVLQPWTSSSAIKIGNDEVNSITLKQSATSIQAIINGTSLVTVSNILPANLKVGLMGASADYTRVVASFDNLTISRL